MTEKEKMYIKKYGKEFLNLKESCQIWVKPGYSTLSKELPKIGYSIAVQKKIIPNYKKIGNTYMFKIKDIVDFIDD
jgi:hypothetical protein